MGVLVNVILYGAVLAIWGVDVAITAKWLNARVFEGEAGADAGNSVTHTLASIILVAWATNTALGIFNIAFFKEKNYGANNALNIAAAAIGWVAFGLACKQQKIDNSPGDQPKTMAAFAIIGAPLTTLTWLYLIFSTDQKPFASGA